MPCIQTKTNIKITPAQEQALKEKFGDIIELIPGKSEKWLMLLFEDGQRLWFHGENQEPTAFVEVKVFGTHSRPVYEKFTDAVCTALYEELGIEPKQVYVKYEQIEHWGWNSRNF